MGHFMAILSNNLQIIVNLLKIINFVVEVPIFTSSDEYTGIISQIAIIEHESRSRELIHENIPIC